MSTEPTDIVRLWYATGDASLLADDIVWTVLDTFPEGGRHVGRRAVTERFFPAVKSHFTEYAAQPETFVVCGENVATSGFYQVRTKRGQAGTVAFAHFWTVRNGQIVALHQVADTARLQDLLRSEEAGS
ncbi:hypothetical protein AA23498_2567 [Acetobacter nitrogenifigens DSM 23921 = NBRC 105050]|uniref:SnoaL-like domain-containing protein n=1 Tax=Acetobacter nitrogenifigens DSM 23921 = NBRC 105050 TaxID=1120919 RepID=A0A511X641_9PROT|nr:nuclear transport factor 2 family protein [Acetobacter nitrogenifigens]GBQ96177.1 hypothetical protein AA23498_2567 [Acetobacter nitrogenifigens DSM 23921 = NBRC 105050]GEN58416.1 hypothetical protein ANI02nite_03000 [Acetobacter nitrogenifigens DSM 23921 = NBRC 105050]